MRTSRIIPIATLALLMGTVACKKPAPAPTGPSQAEIDAANAKKAADEAAAQKAAAEEAARKAAAEEAARKAAAEEAAQKAAAEEAAFKAAAEKALVNIHFDYDKSDIKEGDRAILQGIADFMKQYSQARIEIQGNCDERGTNEYNLALGNRRADAAQAYLKTLGVAEDRMSTISFGKEKPLCTEHKESCWSQNRRDEFHLK